MKDLELNSIKDLKKEGKSFYWASFFLPKKSKENAGILYSICRYFDNVADKNNEDQSEYFARSIEKIQTDNNNVINIFFKKNNINILLLVDLLEGLIIDQSNIKIKNQRELVKYSYHVAGTVGLMMSKILGVKNNLASSCAIDLGIAMQLTNIVRDVYEDAQMERVYLPSDWLPNISLSILNGRDEISYEQEEKISSANNRLIELSEKFYKNGFSGLKYIPYKSRLGIFIAANVYMGIGRKIKKFGKKYLKKRVYLTNYEKFIITIKSIFIFMIIPLLNYKYLKLRDSFPNENL